MSDAALVEGYVLLLKTSKIPPSNWYFNKVLADLKAENPKLHAAVLRKLEQ